MIEASERTSERSSERTIVDVCKRSLCCRRLDERIFKAASSTLLLHFLLPLAVCRLTLFFLHCKI